MSIGPLEIRSLNARKVRYVLDFTQILGKKNNKSNTQAQKLRVETRMAEII